MSHYVALIHKEADSDFGVSFPDFPGCVTAGATLTDAATMAAEALGGHIDLMVDQGQAVPRPSGLDTIMADSRNRDGVPVLIPGPVRRSGRVVRINVTIQEDVLARVDAHAEQRGMNRSAFLTYAAKRQIEGQDERGQ